MNRQFTRPKLISRPIMPLAERRYSGPAALPRSAVNSTAATPSQKSSARRGWVNWVGPKRISLALTGLVIIVFIAVFVIHSLRSPNFLPTTIAKQISFGVYFPKAKTTVATIDKGTIRYQASGGLFSYTAKLADGTTVSVNQQATPVSFVDIPQAYDKLVSSLQPYTSFESINGKVSLTYPKELKGGQSAVMNAKGTLLFARPSKSLSDDQWRQLFNGLFADQIPAAK